ncbi:hypothetical protein HLB44_08525 [Aquincola sp. S2]|uniref:Uncharacterized protein n=1 Tax=Pseudaquabacterium terrae TaxID=2732868 RepID=A0ABX2EEI4_9BURK|nr:hypothetical protein [Aquabacterium terrae]NRF67023.1 hypothetical protein [Aquabacterium terrae]
MGTPTALLPLTAAVLLMMAWHRSRLHGLILIAIASVLLSGPLGATALDAEAAQGALLAASALLAGGAWSLFAALARPGPSRSINPQQRSGASAIAHVALRLLVCAFVAMFASMFGTIAPGIADAVPALTGYGMAGAILLLVWSLWPVTEYHRASCPSRSRLPSPQCP